MQQETAEAVEYILIIKAFEASDLGTSVEFSPPRDFLKNQAIESIYLGTGSSTGWLGA